MRRIPTTLLCGFLGSGKTTRINRMIHAGAFENALFLVNDFGRINIDAELIESRADNILRLTNGCACCGIAGDLSAQLLSIRDWPQRPAQLVFEASGIARPRPLMQLFEAASGYRLEHAESLVDASAFDRHVRDTTINDIVIAQIREVSALRINRIDWLDDTERDNVLQRIDGINPSARLIIEETGQPPPCAAPPTRGGTGPLVTESVALAEAVDIQTLTALLASAAGALVRAKGLVCGDDGTRYLVQFAGGRVTRTATRAGRNHAIVLIGHRSDTLTALIDALRRL